MEKENKSNDQKIIELKAQVAEKKSKLAKLNKFTPLTNLSLELDGQRYNLNTLQESQLIHLLVKITAYKKTSDELLLSDRYELSGYNVFDWLVDINNKLEVLSRRTEEQKLKALESKLHELLSNDKKIELELSDIENMLK